MIKTLYKPFQRWSEKGSVYLISDTHFDDPDRNFMGYTISENEQIAILKKKIHKNDTLIHLGDVGNIDYIKQLKCYKVLIMGNHDQSKTKYEQKYTIIDLDNLTDEEIKSKEKNHEIDYWGYEFHSPFKQGYKSNNLFNEVYDGPLWISQKLILSHEPLSIGLGVTNQPIAFNIHGHDHSGEYYKDDYHLNICQNVFGYEPLNLKSFIEEGFLSSIPSVHRATINYQKEKKSEKNER